MFDSFLTTKILFKSSCDFVFSYDPLLLFKLQQFYASVGNRVSAYFGHDSVEFHVLSSTYNYAPRRREIM